jgi:hypothetical protein
MRKIKAKVLNPTIITNPTNKKNSNKKGKPMATTKRKRTPAKKGTGTRRKTTTAARRSTGVARKTSARRSPAKKTVRRRRRNPASGIQDLIVDVLLIIGGFMAAKYLAQKVIDLAMPDKPQFKPAIEAAFGFALAYFGKKFMSDKIAKATSKGALVAALYSVAKQFLPDDIKASLAGHMGENGTSFQATQLPSSQAKVFKLPTNIKRSVSTEPVVNFG